MTTDELLAEGLTQKAAGNLAGAEQSFREADALGSAAGSVLLGLLLNDRGKRTEAVKTLRRAGKRCEAVVSALGQRAENTQAMSEEPGSASPEVSEAESILQSSDLGQLVAEGQAMSERQEESFLEAHPSIDLAITLADSGESGQAIAYLLEEIEPDDKASAWWAIERIHEDLGEPGPARDAYGKSVEHGQLHGAFRLGILLLAEGDEPGARAALEHARDCGHEDARSLIAHIDDHHARLAQRESLPKAVDPGSTMGHLGPGPER